jgi:hypothetical protein
MWQQSLLVKIGAAREPADARTGPGQRRRP